MHAGELETSILLAAHPAEIREGWQSSDHTASDRRYLTTLGINAYTTSGVIGYPARPKCREGAFGSKPSRPGSGKTHRPADRSADLNGSRWRLPCAAAPVRRHKTNGIAARGWNRFTAGVHRRSMCQFLSGE
jgi:hypothetical protein